LQNRLGLELVLVVHRFSSSPMKTPLRRRAFRRRAHGGLSSPRSSWTTARRVPVRRAPRHGDLASPPRARRMHAVAGRVHGLTPFRALGVPLRVPRSDAQAVAPDARQHCDAAEAVEGADRSRLRTSHRSRNGRDAATPPAAGKLRRPRSRPDATGRVRASPARSTVLSRQPSHHKGERMSRRPGRGGQYLLPTPGQ
jgi:hypothetical protein